MKETKLDDIWQKTNSHECSGCSALFETVERLREHEVDCKCDDDAELQ